MKALSEIRCNIVLATTWVAMSSLADFEADLMTFYAVTRALEIISEASRRLPDDLVARHPGIAWRSMRDAGNFYRHDYDHVLEEFVWSTVTKSLPPLLVVVEAELARIDRHPEGRP